MYAAAIPELGRVPVYSGRPLREEGITVDTKEE